MRVILNREEKEEEPAPPSIPPSSTSTAGAPAASAAVADVVSSNNALSVSASAPLSSREGVQNSPCAPGTGTTRNNSTTTADGQQLRRPGGQQPFPLAREVAASSCVPAQEASKNGKQRAPNSFGDDQERANSDDELDDDVNRGGMDRRTKPPSSAGDSGSAEEVVVSSSSSSREGNACLITGALAAPRFCDSIAGESLRSATTTAGRNCASSTAGRNCASSTTGRNCASSTAGRSSASSTPTFSCTGTDVGTSDSGAAVVPETGELGAEAEAEEEAERAFEAQLRAKGWELRRQEGDGNCLFRAISQQIYGDPGMHADIRRQCVDFMRKERDHYSQFVSEPFDSYVNRKEKDGVHGNNPEMQAASELFNRPIEVYVPERGAIPMNIFHGGYRTSNAPIRVSYHGRSHYNAVIDPQEASIGQGLGVPGLSKEAAEKEALKRALAESCSSAHQVFPHGSATSPFYGGGGRGSLSEADFVESDLRATEEELEQAAITASLAEFNGTNDFGGSSAFGRSSSHNSNDYLAKAAAAAAAAAAGRSETSFPLSRRGGRGSHSGLASGRHAARGSSSSRGVGGGRGERRGVEGGSGRAPGGGDAGRGSSRNADFGSGSGNSPRKRRRPGSPTSPLNQATTRKGSPGSQDTLGSSADSSSAVREMVWSYGFPLARVLHAHDLVGDSVEDMLVLLTSDAFQPPEPSHQDGSQGAAAAPPFSDGV